MRVIAGKYRSRHLKSPKGMALRPTSDRLRETLFNILGDRVAGAFFVDLFAGTGAVGIEALSRGARKVVFIEKHAPAVTLIKKNLESLEANAGTRILAVDALRGLEVLAKSRTGEDPGPDLVYVDPPYGNSEDYERVLRWIGFEGLLPKGSLVIAEHRRNFESPEAVGNLQRVRMLRQGDAVLSFYRLGRKVSAES